MSIFSKKEKSEVKDIQVRVTKKSHFYLMKLKGASDINFIGLVGIAIELYYKTAQADWEKAHPGQDWDKDVPLVKGRIFSGKKA